ncbi:MAG: hypothetical protein JO360_03890, partial [Acidobacteria bacterium]|nr:hypothetical protein [Acidobacteriota bacterium]
DGLEKLVELRRSEGVYSITASIIRLSPDSIAEATRGFEDEARIAEELKSLLSSRQEVYAAYVVTHFNYRPMDELTVFIGGDCYRTGEEIKDLKSVLSRTKDLAQAMIRKAVMIFPDIPTLHGGKKGEWIILDREGRKIEGLSEEAIVALGTLIIPKGIKFLNDYKEMSAQARGVFEAFPARNVIRPDTASPDVVSGPNWKAMCQVWQQRGLDLSYVTCLPEDLSGPRVPSSYSTGYGVVATAVKLVQHYFRERPLGEIRFLLEALGGVGQATIEKLLADGCRPENITAFDKSAKACKLVSEKFGIRALTSSHDEFYRSLDGSQQYDVWINNGEGDNTLPEHVDKLLASGVKIFCGAANNFLQQSRKRESLQKIFDGGAWAWPDEAASGGGWTLAVIDVLTRSKGERSSSQEVRNQILETIISRNEKLVDEVVGGLIASGQADGQSIWRKVAQSINERVDHTLDREFAPEDIARQADVTTWRLT